MTQVLEHAFGFGKFLSNESFLRMAQEDFKVELLIDNVDNLLTCCLLMTRGGP